MKFRLYKCVKHFASADSMLPPHISDSFVERSQTYMTLHDDFTVTAANGATGHWTMVYDEGLHIEITSPFSIRYFSFFKYKVATDGRNVSWSFCHTLMVGWWKLSEPETKDISAVKAPLYGKALNVQLGAVTCVGGNSN